jgi:hypothetical protein
MSISVGFAIEYYRELADEWFVIYNGDSNFEVVANNKITLDPNLYKKFLEDIAND